MLLPVCGGVFEDVLFVDVDDAAFVFESFFDDAEVEAEDFAGGCFVEGWVVETDVYPGCKGFVEVAYSIRCEEEDAGVVF